MDELAQHHADSRGGGGGEGGHVSGGRGRSRQETLSLTPNFSYTVKLYVCKVWHSITFHTVQALMLLKELVSKRTWFLTVASGTLDF